MKYTERSLCGLDVLEVSGKPGAGAVLFFHGFGADAHDVVGLSETAPHLTWYFPHGPLPIEVAPGYFGKAWFEIDIPRLQVALRQGKLEDVARAFPPDIKEARVMGERLMGELKIPVSQLYLGGFSQGAVLAAEIGLHFFEKVAGLILLSGTLVNDKEWNKLAHQHAGMSFFQSHGLKDPILPIQGAELLEKTLVEGGLKGKLHTFQGGHEIPQLILKELSHYLR